MLLLESIFLIAQSCRHDVFGIINVIPFPEIRTEILCHSDLLFSCFGQYHNVDLSIQGNINEARGTPLGS